ncbi:V-set domain-containing T-cell activation inhibitor 1-like [Hyla sarda]|uniref:V-set domain-containing T-cell activation inhibitor 1-like n=1 Tax=Hyla sarda TaxID=327740 RepID=UPI0024C2D50F|nr:V-set domain-containing T-cell activation inhibitor 1-like [Hyla sarda]
MYCLQVNEDEGRQGVKMVCNVHLKIKILLFIIFLLLVVVIGLIIGLCVPGYAPIFEVRTRDANGKVGESVILHCAFTSDGTQSSNVLWEKVGDAGVVYRYENGNILLDNQNPNFTNRTSLFLELLPAGDASLTIDNLQMKDAGEYMCTVTNSKGKKARGLRLNVGVFSDLVMTLISQNTLRCSSPSWFPRPSVQWRNDSGYNLTSFSNTTYEPGPSGTFMVNSEFKNAEKNKYYTCVIENDHGHQQGKALITDTGLQWWINRGTLSEHDNSPTPETSIVPPQPPDIWDPVLPTEISDPLYNEDTGLQWWIDQGTLSEHDNSPTPETSIVPPSSTS